MLHHGVLGLLLFHRHVLLGFLRGQFRLDDFGLSFRLQALHLDFFFRLLALDLHLCLLLFGFDLGLDFQLALAVAGAVIGRS